LTAGVSVLWLEQPRRMLSTHPVRCAVLHRVSEDSLSWPLFTGTGRAGPAITAGGRAACLLSAPPAPPQPPPTIEKAITTRVRDNMLAAYFARRAPSTAVC